MIFNVCWFIVLAHICVAVNGNFYYPVKKHNDEWWANTIIYQLYPLSFKDSNNDGYGDFKGIIQKLDHFVDLGIETLWIGPFFKSPMEDMGYDVIDFKQINPLFGTMDDYNELISEMKKRNLHLITDIVPNHSSDQCEWFKKSIKREGNYSDYYIWHDAKNQMEVLKNTSITPIPPNNWVSVFSKSAWTWHNDRKQFYYHQFGYKQPDFNLRNPKLRQELLDILKFWLDRGVDGFRCDAMKHLYEYESLIDEPYLPGKEGSLIYSDMIHNYTTNLQEVIDTVIEWREFLDNYTKSNNLSVSKIFATESYAPLDVLKQYYGNTSSPGAQIPLNFNLVNTNRNYLLKNIDRTIREWLEILPDNGVANWDVENHDNHRIASMYGPETVPLFTALKLALPGIDITYYGSEIGMVNTYVRPDQRQDPQNAGGSSFEETRDGERTPMQWDDSINAGFTEAKKPWLPVNPNYYKLNVETQKKIPTSNYNFYKKMARLRKTDTLKYGDLKTYNVSESIYVLKRALSEHEFYVFVFNFGSETEEIVLSNIVDISNDKLYVYLRSANALYSEGNAILINSSVKPLIMRPQSVVVLTDKEISADDSTKSSSTTRICSKLLITLCTFFLTRFLL
ncbi:Glycoside hydrolase superfamily,Glycosyl hydrolase, family 13, catalytic domain [Cinara cedri]|uniref:alpha-glucosidase n=1 Tax=Cinara cedri TaxID=506608 RepID=A0A5E4MD79_9HEMI|nr:Glycoside hydrolase superfamily,Glycosyl hydrolase, family 13, catalytic domain [Cinara cedri]